MNKLRVFAFSAAIAFVFGLSGCGGSESEYQHATDVDVPSGELVFPDGFLWGSASSAYQVEGAWNEGGRGLTNWDVYTQTMRMANGETGNVAIDQYHRYAEDVQLMADAGVKVYRFSVAWARIYPTGFPFQMKPDFSGPVLDENGMPISALNPEGVAYYNNLIDELIANGIEPVMTLYHWDTPAMLWMQGAFNNRMVVDLFAAYAAACFENFGDRVGKWITFNEPFVWSTMFEGLMAIVADKAAAGETISSDSIGAMFKNLPFQSLLGKQMTYVHNTMLAHAKSKEIYDALAAQGKIIDGEIGISYDASYGKPASDSAADIEAARLYNVTRNDFYISPALFGNYPQEVLDNLAEAGYGFNISDEQLQEDLAYIHQQGIDFMGLNYYSRPTISSVDFEAGMYRNASVFMPDQGPIASLLFDAADAHTPTEQPGSENGIYDPQGFYDTLMWMDKISAGKPIFVSENGGGYRVEDSLTDDGKVHDTLRTRFLDGHIKAMWRAIDDGANVVAYNAWALFDNFEWFNGYAGRFGLIYIDYEDDLKRYPKDSYYWYSNVMRNNSITKD